MSPRTRFLLMLGGGVLALVVASAALAAALADGGGSRPETIEVKGDPPTALPADTPLDDLPRGLRERIAALPRELQIQLLRAIEDGRMAVAGLEDVLRRFEGRNRSVRAGSVLEASATRLAMEVATTGERVEMALDGETELRRGLDRIEAQDLKRGELVLVLSMDGGETAFSVTAFGVNLP
jgi:hypothetical protein